MGKLVYDSTYTAEFDDRLLAHLQLAIGTKLRRGEAFHLSWSQTPQAGSGRTILWIHPTISLLYQFHGSKMPRINRAWIDALLATAHSPAGLQIVPEPEAPPMAPPMDAL